MVDSISVSDHFLVSEHLSYDMVATWIKVRDQQRMTDDPDRKTWRDFDRMRDALHMVVTPWCCEYRSFPEWTPPPTWW